MSTLRKSSYFLIWILQVSAVSAQDALDQFLENAVTDQEITQLQELDDYLANHKFNSPWFRDLDIRFRSNDIELDLEEYRARLGLINPLEIRANKNYEQTLKSQSQSRSQIKLNDVLKNRYQLLIEDFSIYSQLKLSRNYLNSLDSLLAYYTTQSEIAEIIQVQADVTKTQLTINDFVQRQKALKAGALQRNMPLEINWNEIALIGTEGIADLMESLDTLNQSIKLRNSEQELALSTAMYKIQKAEAFSNLGFVQAEYDLEKGSIFGDHLGFQVGLSIPVFNKDRPELQRRELKLLEDRLDNQMLKTEETFKKQTFQNGIEESIIRLQLLESKLDEWQKLKKLAELSGDVKSFYRLREYQYYLLNNQLDTRIEQLLQLIELAHNYGLLAGSVPLNFLAADLHVLDFKGIK